MVDDVQEYISDTKSVLARNYIVYYKIGSGSFGQIFSAECRKTGKRVAVKLESANSSKSQLIHEYKMYRAVRYGKGIPQVSSCYTESDVNVMVMEQLGPSLHDLFGFCGSRFSVKTVAMLAEQMIERLQYVHSKRILHRDIKPNNFLMGQGFHKDRLFLIDFGLAKLYWNETTDRHIPSNPHSHMAGTARYASINAMRGCEQSRRDDLEALGYLMMYLLRGNLPWQGILGKPLKQSHERIAEAKESTRLEELCQDFPDEFRAFISYSRSLGFEEVPHYMLLRHSFRGLMKRLGYAYDGIFDWTIKQQQAESEDEDEEYSEAESEYQDAADGAVDAVE